jgi:nitronate monooxygenase
MKIETAITRMLGIDLPIIGAPMFLVSYPDLVCAVSNAGGIGSMPALNYRTTDELRAGLTEIRSRTKKPIGINLILHKEHNPNWMKQFEICLEFKVELLITSLGSPRTIIKEAKSVGSKVFCDITTLKHANIVAKSGADALIAVAQGAGGHAGAISPFALIPYLKAEIPDLPVVAAGSISTGKQMAAALALGADAVYLGTRLIATPEAQAYDEYKQMLIDSAPEEIIYSPKISGIPANWLKRSLDKLDPDFKPDTGLSVEAKSWKEVWSAGHGVAQIKSVEPAEEVIRSMAIQYLDVRKNLPGSMDAPGSTETRTS